MVQKKLPLINSAHGSETRNIINEIIKAINDRGLEILSESSFLTWLDENGIKHREEVATFADLPSSDSLNTVRGVFEDNKIYIKKENGWIPFQSIDISKINQVENNIDSRSLNPIFPPAPLVASKADGVTDDHPSLQALVNYVNSSGGGKVDLPAGKFLIKDTLVIPQGVHVSGSGFIESYPGNTSKRPTRIIKDSVVLGVDVRVSASIKDLIIDGAANNLGDGLRLRENSAMAENVIVTQMGGDGIRIGDKETKVNGNAWTLTNCKSLRNKGHGFVVDTLNTGAGPDANGGMAIKCNAWQNDKSGWFIGECAVNSFIACYSESNKEHGWFVSEDGKRNGFINVQSEQNVISDFTFEASSSNNLVITSSEANIVDEGYNTVVKNTGGSYQHLRVNRSIVLGNSRVIQGLSNEVQSTSNSPGYVWNELDAPEGTKSWHVIANGGNLQLRTVNDDGTLPVTHMSVNRNKDGVRNFEFRKPINALEGVRYSKYKSVYEQPIGSNPLRVIEVFNTEGISLGFMPLYPPASS